MESIATHQMHVCVVEIQKFNNYSNISTVHTSYCHKIIKVIYLCGVIAENFPLHRKLSRFESIIHFIMSIVELIYI
jgi:hypothetical protein